MSKRRIFYDENGVEVTSFVWTGEQPPEITVAQRDAITPQEGMQYRVEGIGLQVYRSGGWRTLTDSGQIVNDLTTGGAEAPLSAEQGKELQDSKVAKSGDTMTGLLRATAGINFEASGGDTLNDYEIGTWTPEMSGSGGSAGSFAVASVEGCYQRIGNICIATAGLINITNKGSWTGDVRVSLPFASKDISLAVFKGTTVRSQEHTFVGVLIPETFNSSFARFIQSQSATARIDWNWSDLSITSGNFINFTIIFEIAP